MEVPDRLERVTGFARAIDAVFTKETVAVR
jgi:hypothetical protein